MHSALLLMVWVLVDAAHMHIASEISEVFQWYKLSHAGCDPTHGHSLVSHVQHSYIQDQPGHRPLGDRVHSTGAPEVVNHHTSVAGAQRGGCLCTAIPIWGVWGALNEKLCSCVLEADCQS